MLEVGGISRMTWSPNQFKLEIATVQIGSCVT